MPVSGKKSGHFAFYIKESRRIFFSFYSSFRLTIRSLSRLEKRSPEFSTERERRFFVWKKRGKLRFSTVCRRSPAESAPHAVFAPECVRNRAIACVPSRSVPSKKTPSVTVHAMTEGVFLFYIILRNTSCAIWKYRIKLQASTMVVIKGVAMMAGSAPSFLAASGSMPPTSFARMTLKNSDTLTTMA